MRSISFKITEKLIAGIELEAGFFFHWITGLEAFGVLVHLHFPHCSFKPGFHIIRWDRQHHWKIGSAILAIPMISTINRFPYDRCDRWENKGLISNLFGALKPGILPRGVLPSKRLLGMCHWMGSHFHNWTDYNGITFLVELLEWGRKFPGFLG